MKTARRDWAFYIQLAGLAAFWLFALAVVAWFAWRGVELKRYGDAWGAVPFVGTVVGGLFVTFASLLTYLFIRIGATPQELETDAAIDPVEQVLTRGVLEPWSLRFKLLVGTLAVIFGWSLFAWWYQVRNGLGVTGLSRPVFWGIYIIDFVFFIGISHAGTLVSAILRIAQAEWRRAITRLAEAITVLVLFFGAWNILLDMGRVDRVLNMFTRGRLESPLLWDVCSVSTYLVASTLYLYLPLIPDLALLRTRVRGWRRHLYHLLAFGWTGAPAQVAALERAIRIMAVLVVPIAISVHTVVSWVFSMTIQPMWHSTIFGPYFVVGAIFSGIAALLIAMAVVRWHQRLQDFIRPIHFNNLGILLMVMACLWFYFTASEYVTVFYGHEPHEMTVFMSKFGGRYAPMFWAMVIACFVIPVSILSRRRTRTVHGTVAASISVCIGMWLERYTIVVPTLESPRLPYGTATYAPTWLELSLLFGTFSGFILLYLVFTRFFPAVSLWEVHEGRVEVEDQVIDRVRSYFPVTGGHGSRESRTAGLDERPEERTTP